MDKITLQPSVAYYTFDITLNGKNCTFTIRYNHVNQIWIADIYDNTNAVQLIRGLALVLGVELLHPYNFNIGSLFLYDNDSSGIDAGVDDLGDRVILVWNENAT